jgi:aminoglycoside phosphotransferase family enzyme
MNEHAKKVTVEIPVSYLIQIATHGNMGTGKLSAFMHAWAERACRENGLHDEVVKELDRKIKQSRKNLENLLGKPIMDELDTHIDKGLEKAQKLWRRGDESNPDSV